MKLPKFAIILISPLIIAACSQPKASAPPPPPENLAQTIKPPTPQEMQKAFALVSTKGPEHDALKILEGTWNTKTSWWMDPSGQPEVTKGVSTQKAVLGGKFIRQDYKGESMGKPFEGVGFLGYDTVKQKYTTSWIDSMSTASMNGTGSFDANTNAWGFESEMSCPLMGDNVKVRSLLKVLSKNEVVYEMYAPGFDGKEFKSLEVVYTRAKKAKS